MRTIVYNIFIAILAIYLILYTLYGVIFTLDSEGLSMWYWESNFYEKKRYVQVLIWKRK